MWEDGYVLTKKIFICVKNCDVVAYKGVLHVSFFFIRTNYITTCKGFKWPKALRRC